MVRPLGKPLVPSQAFFVGNHHRKSSRPLSEFEGVSALRLWSCCLSVSYPKIILRQNAQGANVTLYEIYTPIESAQNNLDLRLLGPLKWNILRARNSFDRAAEGRRAWQGWSPLSDQHSKCQQHLPLQ